MDVMTTSPTASPSVAASRSSLRLRINAAPAPGTPDGAWWPRSRSLQAEGADLLDHFPTLVGRIDRLLFSRPDWDDSMSDGRGVRSVLARRGRVKVGSFPSDDTHLMVLTMATGQRLKLLVIPSDTAPEEGERLLTSAGQAETTSTG